MGALARGRMISKSLSTSQRFAKLTDVAGKLAEFCQSLYPLLTAHSDDFGRLPGDPFTVKHVCHPTSPRRVHEFELALQHLDDVGLIRWYAVDGAHYVQIEKFYQHQTGLTKRTKSRFPACPERFEEVPAVSLKPVEVDETPVKIHPELKRTELKDQNIARIEPRAPTKALLSEFDRLHVERVGKPAHITGAKDAALVAKICTRYGEDETRRLMRAFFDSPDPFIRDGGYTVGVFWSQVGKLLAATARLPSASKPREPSAADVLRAAREGRTA